MATKKKTKEAHVAVTLVKRPSTEKLRKIAFSMGLRKMNDTKHLPDRPEIRGMIFAIKHLLAVTEEK